MMQGTNSEQHALVPMEKPSWFAVQTKPRHEKKVHADLHEKGIHSFLPLFSERRQWSDRQQWIETPVFSHYLFAQIPAAGDLRVRLLRTSGVVRLAGAPGLGTPIPDEQIDNLQAIVAQRIPMAPHEFIRIGEKVRIRGGALDGIEGVLVALRNDKSLIVSVDLIQKSIAIRIQGFEVDRI
jgi:transcription antitermination factor NusG